MLSRGSQYRVESMMARLAHTQNYLLLHPGKENAARQPGGPQERRQHEQCISSCGSSSSRHCSRGPHSCSADLPSSLCVCPATKAPLRTPLAPPLCPLCCAAMEALPLVMEPESRLYTDPVVVLDFQASRASTRTRACYIQII